MLPKNKRLSTKSFATTWSRGTSSCGSAVCVRILTKTPDLRCACIAPKKIAPSAVQRNTMRRRLYSAASTALAHNNLPMMHIIINPKGSARTASHALLVRDIIHAITKALRHQSKYAQK